MNARHNANQDDNSDCTIKNNLTGVRQIYSEEEELCFNLFYGYKRLYFNKFKYVSESSMKERCGWQPSIMRDGERFKMIFFWLVPSNLCPDPNFRIRRSTVKKQ